MPYADRNQYLKYQRKYHKRHYKKNRKQILRYSRKRYKDNPEYWSCWYKKNRKKIPRRYKANRKRLNRKHRRWYRLNREYVLLYAKQYRKENLDQILEKERAYAKAHPEKMMVKNNRRRARKRRGSFTLSQWLDLKEKFNFRCLFCGLTEKALKKLNRVLVPDHIKPLVRGGSNSIRNIQPLCHGLNGCNNHKGSKIIDYRKFWKNGRDIRRVEKRPSRKA